MSESEANARSRTDTDHGDGGTDGDSPVDASTLQSLPVDPRTAAFAGLGAMAGVATALGGVRALRQGKRARGLAGLLVGAGLGIAALRWGRSSAAAGADATDEDEGFTDVPIDESDGVEGSEAEATERQEGAGAAEGASAESGGSTEEGDSSSEQAELAGADADLDRGASETEGDAEEDEEDGTEAEGITSPDAQSYERLGGAAFDEHADEVPLPQEVFDRQLLALGSEAFWGIREDDDAVIVAGQFDPLQDRDGVRYVASSEVDDERTLAVPDVALDHWDEIAGGGTVVASGTELVFATSDEIAADDWVLVVPEHRVEAFPGELE